MQKLMSGFDFEDIRPYTDAEVPEAIKRIAASKRIELLLQPFLSADEIAEISNKLKTITTVNDFQFYIVKRIIDGILKRAGSSLYLKSSLSIKPDKGYLFISNHRDIVLDPSFLGYLLLENGFSTAEIAIGNNLLIEPWIEDLVKVNKSFIVKRDIQGRELLLASSKISAYIRHSITERKSNVWIAQREGRAKDGNDVTQPSLLKMLHISSPTDDLVESFSQLNIVPVAITYEYDPCDVLKAKELYLHSLGIEYEKTTYDDLISMKWGLLGLKGRVCYSICPVLNYRHIGTFDDNQSFFDKVALYIDKQIYGAFELFPTHFYAFDMYHSLHRFTHKYTQEQVDEFEQIIDEKIQRLLPEFAGNIDFRKYVYLQYANVLKNALTVNPLLMRK